MNEIWNLDEYSKYFTVHAFHVEKPIDANGLLESLRQASNGLDVQVVDLDRIAGKKHLYFAMLNAVHSFQRGMNISRTLAVEFLLYASGQKQISEAIRMMGVDKNTRNLLVVAAGGDKESVERFADRLPLLTNSRNETSLLDQWSEKKIQNLLSVFKINEKELAAMSGEKTPLEETVQKLILERVAMLPTVT